MSTEPTPRALVTRYADAEPLYRAAGYSPIPVDANNKKPACKNWTALNPSDDEIADRVRNYPNASFGLLAGSPLAIGLRLGFIDIDYDPIVPFVLKVVGDGPAKRGAKGRTLLVAATEDIKSCKIVGPAGAPVVEVFSTSGQVVMPDSMHPSGVRYTWVDAALLDVDAETLPQLTESKLAFIKSVLDNELAWDIIDGGPGVKAHDIMLRLASSGIAHLDESVDWLAECLAALFHPDYAGNTREEIREMLSSARRKSLGAQILTSFNYDPGEDGPRPLGFAKDGSYVLLDPERKIIIPCSANQLLSEQFLVGLAPTQFWRRQFPSEKSFHARRAGEAVIAACRKKGPFNPLKVRGRGVWREGQNTVINFGDVIESTRYIYLCFERIDLEPNASFDAKRLLALLQAFNWRNPQDAMLLLGWLALAPICGVLDWRPHAFVYGPHRSGKTTIHSIATRLLGPLVVSADGQSSEAGIRQTLGPDSLPVVIDEFESDQNGGRLQAVMRLARSASSAEAPVLKGTPEGKAMTFSLRSAFFFAAINPRGLSPADQSRVLMLELLMHDNNPQKARFVLQEEAWIRSTGSAWCSHMVANAGLIQGATDHLDAVLGSGDRRVRQNFGALLGAAFVALHARLPTPEEAKALAEEYQPAVDRHAQETERDDAQECLDYLFAHDVADYPLWHWLACERDRKLGLSNDFADAGRVVATYDMIVEVRGENAGIVIGHGSPKIEAVFDRTQWGGRAWQRALHKLSGSSSMKDPVTFGTGRRSRVVVIPLNYLPEKPLPLSPKPLPY